MQAIEKIRKLGFARVIEADQSRILRIDLSKSNRELDRVDGSDPAQVQRYIMQKVGENGAVAAAGGYNEERSLYDSSDLFAGDERRNIHLGIDIWADPGTRIFCPFRARVHSFQINDRLLDYGPTIILEHEAEGIRFYTLYGHLSLDSLDHLHEGKQIDAGQEIARIGNYPSNGNWAPHLHFQLILDMKGMKGDYPGVSSGRNRTEMLRICPDPNLILRLDHL